MSMYLYIHIFILWVTNLGCNPTPHYFLAQLFLVLIVGSSFQLFLVSLWNPFIFGALLCFLALLDASCSSFTFLAPDLNLTVFPRSSGSFHCIMVFRSQNWGAGCAYCYWHATASSPFPWTELTHICMHSGLCIHTHAIISESIFISIQLIKKFYWYLWF